MKTALLLRIFTLGVFVLPALAPPPAAEPQPPRDVPKAEAPSFVVQIASIDGHFHEIRPLFVAGQVELIMEKPSAGELRWLGDAKRKP